MLNRHSEMSYKQVVIDNADLIEQSFPPFVLSRLRRRGAACLSDLVMLMMRGDWKTRACAASALGRVARDHPYGRLIGPLYRLVAPFPPLRKLLPGTGYNVRYVRGHLCNHLEDKSWFVRTAAALALAEIRDPATAPALRAALSDPIRPVRIAVAVALKLVGAPVDATAGEITRGSESPSAHVEGTATTTQWLDCLCQWHAGVLRSWADARDVEAEALRDPSAWARFLAGDLPDTARHSLAMERQRYAQEPETHYNRTKPFNAIDPALNIQLLSYFTALATNLPTSPRSPILDLGAGTGWVSELLTKLGYRTIAVDVSESLLRLGRERFFGHDLSYCCAVGDMTQLPFPSDTFDAAVIIDALHHVPNLPAVFRETFRVLGQGGVFLIAEPGEGHSETEKSRLEMRQHGVMEGEIRITDATRWAREAGFDRIRIIPQFEPVISLSPEDLEYATVTPPERWRLCRGEKQVPFDELILQSVYTHPMLIISKGERVVDSRMPGRLAALVTPDLIRAGNHVHGTVTLRNVGDTVWLSGVRPPGRVRAGIQLLAPDRTLLARDFARADLPRDVPPGGSVDVCLALALPEEVCRYVLKIDLVDEQVCWFEERGSTPAYVPV